MTDAQLAQLRQELETDPAGLGYAEWVADGSDQALADRLNHVRDGVTPARDGKPVGAAITVDRAEIPVEDVLMALHPEMPLTQVETMILNRQTLTAALVRKFGQPYLEPLTTRLGSRAEQLFGSGTLMAHTDIAAALPGRVFGER